MATTDSEYKATQARVRYGIYQAPQPDEALRKELLRLMKETDRTPYVLLQLPVEEMTDVLYDNPDLNKIYSISLDALECLPFRPDMAFDRWWAAFEVLLHEYDRTVWNRGGSPKSTIDLFGRFCNEVVYPELNADATLNDAFEKWMATIPYSVCRYGAVRMLLDREIRVASQYGLIRDRAMNILGEDLYKAFKNEYVTSEEGKWVLNGGNHYRAAKKLNRVLTGQKITFQGREIKGIDRMKALEFVISCILYASRCERLHGDYFSPFFSDKASSPLYAHWYWIADTVYFLFNILLKRRMSRFESNPIESRMLAECISEVTDNINILFPNK